MKAKKNLVLALLASVFFYGCGAKTPPVEESAKEEATEVTSFSTNLSDEAKKAAEEHLVKGSPTVFFFFANWCPACRLFKPTLEEVETKFPGVKVLRMDVDQQKDLTKSFKVASIPTLFFFDKEGKFVESTTGGLSNDVLIKQFEKISGGAVAETKPGAVVEGKAKEVTDAAKTEAGKAVDAVKTAAADVKTEVKQEAVKAGEAAKTAKNAVQDAAKEAVKSVTTPKKP